MCNPAAAVQVAATGLQIGQQLSNYAAMAKYGKETYDANKAAAEDSAVRTYASLQARQIQEHAKASQAIDAAALASSRKIAAARASAAAGGIGGNTVADVLGEFKNVELGYQTTVIRNQAFLDAQFNDEMQATRAQEEARIRSGLPNMLEQPDVLGTALSGLGKVLEINANQTKPLNDKEVIH